MQLVVLHKFLDTSSKCSTIGMISQSSQQQPIPAECCAAGQIAAICWQVQPQADLEPAPAVTYEAARSCQINNKHGS